MPTLGQTRPAGDIIHYIEDGTLTIDAMPVAQSDCGMKTKLFFFNRPYDEDADVADETRWQEVFSDSSTGRIV
jgi:hypothetical protein